MQMQGVSDVTMKRGRKYRYDPKRTTLALMVIEGLAASQCNLRDHDTKEGCFPCKVYSAAHSASQDCPHPTWWAKTKELYRELAR